MSTAHCDIAGFPSLLMTRPPSAPRPARVLIAVIAAVSALAGLAGLPVAPALASVALPGPVSDQASTATPAVPGGQCYPGVADPSACRRVLSMIQVGNWIYVGGIISAVRDANRDTFSGFHNLFRFDATTHQVDLTWQPQVYRTTDAYRDAAVTGLAASADGSVIYATGGFTRVASEPGERSVGRRGVAAFDASTGAVMRGFNA